MAVMPLRFTGITVVGTGGGCGGREGEGVECSHSVCVLKQLVHEV
jgi:hypothetical protein